MKNSVLAISAEIEWRRMADQETYYALRDGPRLYRGRTAIDTLAKHLPPDQIDLGRRLAAMHAEAHSGFGRGAGEIAERVQGGDGGSARDHHLMRLSGLLKTLAGYAGASLSIGHDGHKCYRGICVGDTQAEMLRRLGWPAGSKNTFRRLMQTTLIVLQAHEERLAKTDVDHDGSA